MVRESILNKFYSCNDYRCQPRLPLQLNVQELNYKYYTSIRRQSIGLEKRIIFRNTPIVKEEAKYKQIGLVTACITFFTFPFFKIGKNHWD